MQQVTLNINNSKIEELLYSISSKEQKSVNKVITDMIEEYINLYSLKISNNKTKDAEDFIKLMNENTFSAKDLDLSREAIHNERLNDLY